MRLKNISPNTVTLYWRLTTTSSHPNNLVSRAAYGGNPGVFPQNVNLTDASYVSQLGPNGETTIDVAMTSFLYSAPMPANVNFLADVYIRVSVNPIGTAFPPYDCSGDTFEPDNTSSTGSPIIMGEVQRHNLCPQSDEDWIKVNLPSQHNLLAETFDLEPDSVNPNGNTQLTVLNESASQIGTNQFRGFGPLPGSTNILQSSRVVWHPATSDIFNIKVFPETPINEQEGSGYSLRLVNPSWTVDPVDQASWGPTTVNVPVVWRSGNTIYFIQHFIYEQAELDVLINLDTTLAWEFRRPDVVPNTGVEIKDSNVDFGDYWNFRNGVCVGDYFTNLPNPTDEYSEESNLIPGCEDKDEIGNLDNEEFEVFIDDPTALIAGKVYYVLVKFYIHSSYLNNDYQFYVSKAEHCKKQSWPIPDEWCNVLEGQKSSANLIEGYLQSAP